MITLRYSGDCRVLVGTVPFEPGGTNVVDEATALHLLKYSPDRFSKVSGSSEDATLDLTEEVDPEEEILK